jgi:DNA-binding HxlR family transcriptional regulator
MAYNCPVEAALSVIGGKWKCVILHYLLERSHRFAELHRRIGVISQKMLAQQLRELERDGIVHRHVYPEVPPKVEYSLTEYGRTLGPVMKAMCDWGKAHERRGAAEPVPEPAASDT